MDEDDGSSGTELLEQGGMNSMVLRVMIFGCLGMALWGYDTGVVSGALVMIQEDIALDDVEKEEVVSITLVFCVLGTLAGIPLNAHLGRKPVIMQAAVLYIIGSVVLTTAQSYCMLLVGRSLLGVAIGFASGTVPMYSAEMAPPHLRGTMVAFQDFMIVFGQLLAALVNVCVSGQASWGWRCSMGLAAVPAMVLLVGFYCFLPESPRWLLMSGQPHKAEEVLLEMHSAEVAKRRLLDMSEAIRWEEERESWSQGGSLPEAAARTVAALWATKEVRRASLLGIGLQAMNQLTGINTVMYYSSTILMLAGFSESASIWLAALCCFAQLVGVLVSLASMDTAGRRATALRSCLGVTLSLLLLASSFGFGKAWNCVKVLALVCYLMSFGSGLSSVPFVVNSEIYPSRLRTAGVGQATMAHWMLNWTVSRYFLGFCKVVGTGGAFACFAGIGALGGLSMYHYLPETMGLPLESIDTLFSDPYPKRFIEMTSETSETEMVSSNSDF